jgi:ABC-2 type transport system permease protein
MSLARDTGVIFRRQFSLSLRNPAWTVIGLVQPILYLCFFGPLLRNVADSPGFPPHANPWQVFVPGLLIQLGLFGSSFVGISIIADWRSGVMERMRVTPVSRAALLFGRVGRDVVTMLVQGTILVLAGVAFGLRAPVLGVLIGLGFIAALAISLSSLSYALGLRLKSEDSFAPLLNAIVVPVMLLAGIMLPMSGAPHWLDIVSRCTPFRYLVDAARAAFLGEYSAHTLLWGAAVAVGLVAVSVVAGTRTFQRENA